MMISGAPRSSSRFSRLFRLMTRRYRSLRSEVAKRPPSSCTIGRSSGGMTGTDVEDHGPRVVDPPAVLVPAVEGGDDLQPLDGLLPALHRQRPAAVGGVDGISRSLISSSSRSISVDQAGDGLGPHAALEVVARSGSRSSRHSSSSSMILREWRSRNSSKARLTSSISASAALADGGDLLLHLALAGLDLGVLGPLDFSSSASSSSSALKRRSMSRSRCPLDLGRAPRPARPRGWAGPRGASPRRPR